LLNNRHSCRSPPARRAQKVRNLFLNQRVAPVSRLISRAEWMACKAEVILRDGEEVYLALDLSSVADLTALVGKDATAA
jgi:phage terminase large subunit-like protein